MFERREVRIVGLHGYKFSQRSVPDGVSSIVAVPCPLKKKKNPSLRVILIQFALLRYVCKALRRRRPQSSTLGLDRVAALVHCW